jgi:hypothetical protein
MTKMLVDGGAAINIMPYNTYRKLGKTQEDLIKTDIVVEPPELFQLKRGSHHYTADTNSTHFKRNNSLVCRVSARCNHGSTGSKQVYLARRRVYNHITAH